MRRFLCDHIDDEGMTKDFAAMLRENGLRLEPGAATEDENDIDSDQTG